MSADEFDLTITDADPTPGRRRNKWDATTAPSSGDDAGDGYEVGSLWIDTTNDRASVCLDPSLGAAIWEQFSGFDASALGYAFGPSAAVGHYRDIEVPFDCDIVGWTILADVSGSIAIDLWRDSYANYPPTNADSITASATPSISGATKATSTTLTGWSTTLTKGQILRAQIESLTTIGQADLFVQVRRV